MDEDEVHASQGNGPIQSFEAQGGAGERLDRFLARCLPGVSRTRLQQWIALGAVWSPGRTLQAKSRLRGDETLMVQPLPREADQSFAADPVSFDVIHLDDDLIVIDKPVGLVTHPAPGHWRGTLLNGLLHRFPESAHLPRAGIVHRLDRDTSGLLVVGRNEAACAALVAQLADRSMSRRYLAFVRGRPADHGDIDAAIGRDPRHRTRMAAFPPGAHGAGVREARTHFDRLAVAAASSPPVLPSGRPAADGPEISLIGCRLQTGRTHQIRVHLSHLGHPLEGDALYGGATTRIDRQALHAAALGLRHPGSGALCAWRSPLPEDLRALAEGLMPWQSDIRSRQSVDQVGPEALGATIEAWLTSGDQAADPPGDETGQQTGQQTVRGRAQGGR